MIDLRLNKKRLGLHWHYYKARYLIFLAAALLVANLMFSVTKPQVPPNKKVDVIIVCNAFNTDSVETWQQDLLSMLPPDQQEVNIETTPIIQGQEYTVQQTISARMAANEGTIWIMTADYFATFAKSGAFRDLSGDISSFNLPQGTNLAAGKVLVQTDENQPGKEQLCGIPLDKAPGLSGLFVPVGMVMAFPTFSNANYDNAKIIANDLLSKTQEPMQATQAAAGKQVSLIVANHAFVADKSADWQKGIGMALPTDNGTDVSTLTFYTGRESETAGIIQSRLGQKAGGLCIVPQDVFVALARKGALMPLDSEVSSLKLPTGLDLSAGKEYALQKDKTAGPVQLYGIPLDQMAGLSDFFNPKGMVLAFVAQTAKQPEANNHAGAIAAANWILGKQAQ